MGLFGNKKSPEEKQRELEIDEILSRFDGKRLSNSPYFDYIAYNYVNISGNGGVIFVTGNFKSLLKKEMLNGKLSEDKLEERVIELLQLDWNKLYSSSSKIEDTSIFHTQDDVMEYFGEKYDSKKYLKNKEKVNKSHAKFNESQLKQKNENIQKNNSNREIRRIFYNGYYKCKFGYFGIEINDIKEILELEIEKKQLITENIEERANELINEKDNFNEIKEELLKIELVQEEPTELINENDDVTVSTDKVDNNEENAVITEKQNKNPKKDEKNYDFKCSLDEERTNWSGDKKYERINCEVKVLKDRIILHKKGMFLKSDLGNKTVFFSDMTGVDFDKAGKFHITNSVKLIMKGGEHITLLNAKEPEFDLINNRWREYKIASDKQETTIKSEVSTNNIDDPLSKIKEAKELLDMGAITQEEYDIIKSKYIKLI